MAQHLGLVTSYTNTQPQKRMVTDRIILADAYDIPAIVSLGLDNTSKFRFANAPGRTYEWLEDTYSQTTDTISSGLTPGNTTTTTFTPTTPTIYQVGDVLEIESEKLWVSANNTTYITVVRGYAGSTAAQHANSTAIKIISRARLDGADADSSSNPLVTTGYNYSTIMQKTINVSRTDRKLSQYGMGDPVEYYIDKAMDENMLLLDKLPFYGARAVGSATEARFTGGFKTFVTTNVTNCSSAALTRANIDAALATSWGYGGQPDLLFCGSYARRKINTFFEGFMTTVRDEKVGGMRIDILEHPVGGKPITLVSTRNCQPDYIFIVDSRYAGYITIDPFFYEELAKTGDAEKGQVVGEYGFVCAFEKAHAIIHTFSTTT